MSGPASSVRPSCGHRRLVCSDRGDALSRRRSGPSQSAVKRPLGEPPETELDMQPTSSLRPAPVARVAAYRRLALTILRLDVPTLASDLRRQRLGPGRRTPRIALHCAARLRRPPTRRGSDRGAA